MKHKYHYFLVDYYNKILPIHFMSDTIKRKWFKRKEIKKGFSIYLNEVSLTFSSGTDILQRDYCKLVMEDEKIIDRMLTLYLEDIERYSYFSLKVIILDSSQFKKYTSVLEHYLNTLIIEVGEEGETIMRSRTKREILENTINEMKRLTSNDTSCKFFLPSLRLIELISKIDNIKRKEDLAIYTLDNNEIIREFVSLKLKKLERKKNVRITISNQQ